MARFDVYTYQGGQGLLLDVQADLLEHLNTRVVVPLLPMDLAPKPARHLNPVFEINGMKYVMVTQFLSAVPKSEMGKAVSEVGSKFSEITNALDMVFQGF